MHTPKVSVIVPNYNHDQFLEKRIKSILEQTYQNFEVIILDDCSTDNSREIIEKFRPHPKIVRIVYNERNSGSPFFQWKKGVDLADGDWIWIAESDDYADLKFLEKLIFEMTDHLNIGLIYCDSKIVINNSIHQDTFSSIKNRKFHTKRWSQNYINNGKDEIENFLLPGGTINNTSAVLFNKRILRESDPFDINLRYIGDKYAFIKVLTKSDVLYVKDTLNFFRDPFNSKHTNKFVFYFYEQFLVFDWVFKNMKITNRQLFLKGFYENTRNSLYRDWDGEKVNLYKKLFHLNRYLFVKNILYNFFKPLNTPLKSGAPDTLKIYDT